MSLEGLKFNCGTSFEMVQTAVENAGLEHEVFEPRPEEGKDDSVLSGSGIVLFVCQTFA